MQSDSQAALTAPIITPCSHLSVCSSLFARSLTENTKLKTVSDLQPDRGKSAESHTSLLSVLVFTNSRGNKAGSVFLSAAEINVLNIKKQKNITRFSPTETTRNPPHRAEESTRGAAEQQRAGFYHCNMKQKETVRACTQQQTVCRKTQLETGNCSTRRAPTFKIKDIFII